MNDCLQNICLCQYACIYVYVCMYTHHMYVCMHAQVDVAVVYAHTCIFWEYKLVPTSRILMTHQTVDVVLQLLSPQGHAESQTNTQ